MKVKLGNLEANLTRHCNNGCTSCNHGSPIAAPYTMPLDVLARDLVRLGEVAHFDFFCLQGGEPLLHPRIVDAMEIAINSGIADKCGILTNGKRLPYMTEGFWFTAATHKFEIRLSHYPNLPADVIPAARAKAEHYGVDLRVSNEFESFLKMFTKHADGGQAVWDGCPWKRCYTVHEGYFYHCPIAAFFPGQFPEKFDVAPAMPEVDGYPLDVISESTFHNLILPKTRPLKSCEICTGGMNIRIPWSEERDPKTWIEKSTV